jgi:SOS response regulatory protein OraA/RecX
MTTERRPRLTLIDRIAWYLGRRDHSERELRTKLARFGSVAEIDAAIDQARDRRWLLPPEELAAKIVDRLRRRNKSGAYIRGYLAQRGLPAPSLPSESEAPPALALLVKKFVAAGNWSWDDKRRAARYLVTRGFSNRVATEAVKAFCARNEESSSR